MDKEELHKPTDASRSTIFQLIALGVFMTVAVCVYLVAVVNSFTR